MDNAAFILIFRLAAVLLCATGLVLNSGALNGRGWTTTLPYYTIQSNILCAVIWLIELFGVELSARWRGAAAMAILLTMVVYHFLLSKKHFEMLSDSARYMRFGNLLVHYITPSLMILDFLLLAPRGVCGAADPLYWTIVPIVYFAYSQLRPKFLGALPNQSSKYPYFFVDPECAGVLKAPQGFKGVQLNALAISLAYVGSSYLLRLIYNVIPL